MNIATGAMSTLLPKLAELVVGEYKLQKGVKGEIKELEEELRSMTAALHKVAEVPLDQLDEQVKIWASDVRELSYDIEDKVDVFMLSGKQEHEHTKPFSLKGLTGKATDLYKKAKTNHKIHNVIKDIMDQVKKVAERRDRYKIDNIAARPAMAVVDPRLEGMYRKATELVGISQPKIELEKRILEQDSSSSSRQQSNIISIVGFGGLGKTTLANSLLQDLKAKFDCHIFVSISLNPDIKKIFKNILLQFDDKGYDHIDDTWEMKLLIDKIVEFLKNRRCLCVIDDLWKESAWDTIKLAFQDGHPRSRIIITTRNRSVAEFVGGGVYELKPLSDDDSRKLLNKRVFDNDDGCPPNLREVTGKILKKCGGVPLAIITTASLLASKPMCSEEWEKLNKSIGSGLGNSLDVDKMRKILILSYNDLPFHLKTCLLSLSKYPEDQVIRKDVLIWSWVAEGFITEGTQQPGRTSLQEIGEDYFSELINRSLIQPVPVTTPVTGLYTAVNTEISVEEPACRVHDMVLELINQLSAEEGFVTVLTSEDDQHASTLTSVMQKKIRRLSLQNDSIKSYAASPEVSKEQLSKVRSLDIFGKVASMPPLSSFHVLRVLQVDYCTNLDRNHLNDLGKLRLLRFLRLYNLKLDKDPESNGIKLPESIGELESLETLDIRRIEGYLPRPMVLPVSFARLRKLVRLLANDVELPHGLTLENMTSLQEIVGICVTLRAVTEIGKLRELKVLQLCIPWWLNGDKNELIVKCLQLCPSLQIFNLRSQEKLVCPVDLMARLPSGLQTFTCANVVFEWEFPKWNKAQLSYLTVLKLKLREVTVLPEHLKQLAELPSLRILWIYSSSKICSTTGEQEKLSSASGFPCLTYLLLCSNVLFLKFQHGAMLKLQKLHLLFSPSETEELLGTSSFDIGLENLPSLRHVIIELMERDCPEAEEAEDAVRKAVNDHPNQPSLDLSYYNYW